MTRAPDKALDVVGRLQAALGEPPQLAAEADQPVHTLYWPADRFDVDTVANAGAEALRLFDNFAATPPILWEVVGGRRVPASAGMERLDAQRFGSDPGRMKRESFDAWLSHALHRRTRQRLESQAVEDVRIDFEDGYGNRPDSVEDTHADRAGEAVAKAVASGRLCPRVGIRIKALTPDLVGRATRTLDRFAARLADAGQWPETMVVTLPKVTHAEQARVGLELLAAVEARHQRPAGSIRLEVMVETTESLIAADGRSPLPSIVDAGVPRLLGVHLGVYDFTASLRLAPRHQAPDHVFCDLARGLTRLAVGSRVHLSDGASNVLPVGSAAAVRRAWRIGAAHVTRALSQGYVQGWDMHPGQLVTRHAANIAFWLRDHDDVGSRLAALVDTAVAGCGAQTVEGEVIDEPATGRALLRAVQRASRVGAIDLGELQAAGLRPDEVGAVSFTALVDARRGQHR